MRATAMAGSPTTPRAAVRPPQDVSFGCAPPNEASAGEELAGAGVGGGVAELGHGPGLDLADALPGEVELVAHLLQRAGLAPVEAEAQAQDLALALAQGGQQAGQLVGQQCLGGRLEGGDGAPVL